MDVKRVIELAQVGKAVKNISALKDTLSILQKSKIASETFRIGSKATSFAFLGGALSIVDIVLTWTMDNETVESMKQVIKFTEEKIKNA